MGPNCLTVIVPIRDGRAVELKAYLKAEIDPDYHAIDGTLTCKPKMPFHLLEGLHFASFVILDDEDAKPARLVFEATFDGARDAFVNDLVRIATEGLDAIFSNCRGYPATGPTLPAAISAYLIAHDLGAQLMFRGAPGRTVSQIKREAELRKRLKTCASKEAVSVSNGLSSTPNSIGGVQSLLQTVGVRRDATLAWAEDRYREPPEITFGLALAFVRFLPLIAVLSGLWWLLYVLLLAPFADWLTQGTFFSQPYAGLTEIYSSIRAACTPIDGQADTLCRRVARIVAYPLLPIPPVALLLVLTVLAIRWLQHGRNLLYVNPFAQTRTNSAFSNLLGAIRYVASALTVLFFLASLVETPDCRTCNASDYNTLVLSLAWLLRPHTFCEPKSLASHWSINVVVFLTIAAVFAILLFKRTTISIRDQFLADIGAYERSSKLKLDALRIGLFVTGGALAVSLVNLASRLISANVLAVIPPWLVILIATCVVLAGLSAIFWLLVWHGVLEFVERRIQTGDYRPADELLLRADQNEGAYRREDWGNNRRQNQLVSLTHLKPGWWNYVWLRLTLYVIDVLGRYYFNRGSLGDIPTILSARWVLIDNGRQLLFLDHYSGAWDSYLSEFVDMGAVKGVNAIWTNTFIKVRSNGKDATTAYEFPRTNYIFWKGAQNEPAFKAYVRHSQIETLVWYGAYPDLDIVAVNRATALRSGLFEDNTMDRCDAILQDL